MVDKNKPQTDAQEQMLMRELQEEMRAEQYRKLWDKYKAFIIGGVVAIPLATVGYQVYQNYRIDAAQSAGAAFESARRLAAENKPADAAKAFAEMAKSAPGGYALLARLQTTATLAKDGKTTEAVAAYDAIAAEYEGVIADLARLQAAGLRLGTADWTEMQNRLNPLTDERNAYRAVARELLGLAAVKAGKPDEARKAFLQVVSDAKASPAQRDRVNGHLAGVIVANLAAPAQPPAEKPATAGAGKP
jgi:hypothetical protein